MNLALGVLGTAFAFAGSLLFLIDQWPVIRSPRREAEREYAALFEPETLGYGTGGWPTREGIVPSLEARLKRRRRFYATGVVLFVLGFILQLLALLLPVCLGCM